MRKWNVGWGPVSLCNMNCKFCYSRKKRTSRQDLSYKDWVKFIDENHNRINTINYGTGENTLDYNWFRLVAYIRDNYPEIRQALTTNGYLSEAVEDDFCLKTFINAIDEVDVSIDYCRREKHNLFRGQPKAYDWAIETLKLCKEAEKSTTIVFLGSKQNISKENVDGLFEIAKKYDAILRMNMYRPTEGINANSARFIIKGDEVVDILKHISGKYHILALNDTLFSTMLTGESVEDPSGYRSIRILSDGSITPSTYLINNNFYVANILEENVLEQMEERNSLSEIISECIPKECEGCLYANKCKGGVYDRRYLWYGTLSHKDPYCPNIITQKVKSKIRIEKTGFVSVHDGYLPTMFFKP